MENRPTHGPDRSAAECEVLKPAFYSHDYVTEPTPFEGFCWQLIAHRLVGGISLLVCAYVRWMT
jgi:hypothetical protein